MKITAVVLTKNEEKNIEGCLRSIDFCGEIIIIDDYSTDNTKNEILKIKNQNDKLNIKIFEKHLNNDFAAQRNFGLSKASNDWVLFIDADEEITQELKKEIVSLLHGSVVKENAFYLRRRDFFWKKELKYGEVSQIRQIGLIRLILKNSGRWMGSVHEVFHTANKIGQLNGYLNHYPHPTLKEFINDINYYSTIRAEELFARDVKTNILQIMLFPFGKFAYNYFLKLGFLDGPAGFTYAFMMSFHSFLVRAKLYQLTNKQ
jgi:glycosyltransferase involved in cell wall biosynthesis